MKENKNDATAVDPEGKKDENEATLGRDISKYKHYLIKPSQSD